MSEAALKEWNVNIEALKSGLIDMIVRKGGILDPGNAFPILHRQFYFFPTFLHQSAQALRADMRDRFASLSGAPQKDGSALITVFARVKSVHAAESLEQAAAFQERHLYSTETIESRFHYKQPGLHFIELEIESIEPFAVADAARFDGCVSWIPPGFTSSAANAV